MITFRICKHLAVSVNPTISSGEQTFMNGKSESFANCAAKAVLPEFGGPSSNTDTNPKPTMLKYPSYNYNYLPEVSVERACCINKCPSSKREVTGGPQLIIPLDKH